MVRYELRKILGNRVFVLLLIALLCVHGVLAYRASESDRSFSHAVEELVDRYHADPDAFDKQYEEYCLTQDAAFAETLQAIMNGEDPELYAYEESYTLLPESDYGDGTLYSAVYEQVGRRTVYQEQLQKILTEADRNLGVVVDPYTASYLEQLKERYTALYALPLSDTYVNGWDDFLQYQTGTFLLIPLLLLCAMLSVHADTESGVEEVLFATKKGRHAVCRQKVLALLVLCVGMNALFEGLALGIFAIRMDLSGWGQFLASFDAYRLCPYPIYVYEYLLLRFLIRFLFCFLLSVLFLFLARLFRNALLTLVSGVAVCGIEVLLYRLVSYRLGDLWQALNLYRLLDADSVFRQYGSVELFGMSVPMLVFAPLVWLSGLLILLAALHVLWRYTGVRRIHKRRIRLHFRLPVPHVLACYEMKKIFLRSGLLLPILLLLSCKLLSSLHAANAALPYQESVYRSYMQCYQGVELAEAERMVQEERAYFTALQERATEYTMRLEQGSCTQAEYLLAQAAWSSAEKKVESFERAAAEVARIRELQLGGTDAHVVYDSGWRELLLAEPDLLLLLLLLVPAFAYVAEDRCRFRQILYATAYGRERTALIKCGLCVGYAALFSMLFFLADVIAVQHAYGLPLAGTLAVSVSAFADLGLNGSLLTSTIFVGIHGMLLSMLFALLGYSLSSLIRHPLIPALLLSMILFPMYLLGNMLGGSIRFYSPAHLFSPMVLLNPSALPLCIVLSACTFFLFFWSLRRTIGRSACRKFLKGRVLI